MRKVVLIMFLLCTSAWARQSITNAPLNIKTVDGTVSNYPYQLKVTNGSLTDGSDGTMTLSLNTSSLVIQNTSSLQSGATFYVSSGTATNFQTSQVKFVDGSTQTVAAVITQWTTYTPTWTSAGTPPAISTGTIVGYWRRVGDSMEIRIKVNSSSTTTYGSGNPWNLSIPSGYTIDTSKLPATDFSPIGTAFALLTSTPAIYAGTCYVFSTTAIGVINTSATTNAAWDSTHPNAWTSGRQNQFYQVNASVPIVGWN